MTRVSTPIGAHQTVSPDSVHVLSSVDELYRFSLGFDVRTTWRNPANADSTVDGSTGTASLGVGQDSTSVALDLSSPAVKIGATEGHVGGGRGAGFR